MSFGFALEKAPATGSKGMVVTNHPLASGELGLSQAEIEMLDCEGATSATPP